MSKEYINSLYEKLISLSEIRGELDPVSNQITEERIATTKRMLIEAEAESATN